MSYSLTSVSSLDLEGMGTFFGAGRCLVVDAATRALIVQLICAQQPSSVVMSATLRSKLYHVDTVVAAAGVVQDGQDVESRSLLGAAAATDSAALPGTLPSASVREGTGGGGGNGEEQQRSVPRARSTSRVLFSPDTPSTVTPSAVAPTTVTGLAVTQRSGEGSSSVVPYTYAANRSQIMGSYGSERPGFAAGLNPLQRLHLRTGHAPKAVLLAGLKINAFRGALTTFKACEKLEIGACDACISGTIRQETVKPSSRDLSLLKPKEEVGFDPVQLSTTAIGGENYVNFGLCYASRLAMGYAERTEGNQVKVLKAVKRDWCLPYGLTMRTLHTDFRSVFQSKAVEDYLLEEGVKHDCSAPYQHAHNL
ncbi:hypothetical protein B484DRAFT_440877, partial [Ochromonadaceae sp. CCMP2298]